MVLPNGRTDCSVSAVTNTRSSMASAMTATTRSRGGTGESGPSLDEIKAIIIQVIEAESAHKLRYGLEWNGLPVEYTEERKSDLTGMLVAMQAGIMQLPVTLNLGEYPDGSPVFYEFTKAEEIMGVAAAISNHKIAVCNEEWQEKSSVDWSAYETEQ